MRSGLPARVSAFYHFPTGNNPYYLSEFFIDRKISIKTGTPADTLKCPDGRLCIHCTPPRSPAYLRQLCSAFDLFYHRFQAIATSF